MTNRKKQVGQQPGPEHELHRKGDQHAAAARLQHATARRRRGARRSPPQRGQPPYGSQGAKETGEQQPLEAEPDCRITNRGY